MDECPRRTERDRVDEKPRQAGKRPEVAHAEDDLGERGDEQRPDESPKDELHRNGCSIHRDEGAKVAWPLPREGRVAPATALFHSRVVPRRWSSSRLRRVCGAAARARSTRESPTSEPV